MQTESNRSQSEPLPVSAAIPQGSVLGPTLSTLFTYLLDLPSALISGTLFIYADDTSIFCIRHNLLEVASDSLQIQLLPY